MTARKDAEYWAWHDRMGIQRPGGPVIKDARYRVGKDGALVVVPYIAKANPAALKRIGYTGNGMPVVVPRTSPRPPSARDILADSLEKLRVQQRHATARLEREWQAFDAGRCALAWRNKTMKRWHRLNVEVIKATLQLQALAGSQVTQTAR